MGLMVGFMLIVVFLMPKLVENIGKLSIPLCQISLVIYELKNAIYFWSFLRLHPA